MLIGLTGGIGSGKSTIARALHARGIPVYDTDSEAKRLIATDSDIRRAIIALLGDGAYSGQAYCPAYVSARVFADKSLIDELNRIVHPAVVRDVQRWHREQTSRYSVVESALLYESGLSEICDQVVAVTAPEEVRIARTMQRDGTDVNKVRARIRAQMSDAELAARSGIVVVNDGSQSVDSLAELVLTSLD